MTAVVSTLGVVMDLDSTGFERGLSNVRDKLQDTGRRLQAIGGIMTATVTAPIVGGLGYAVTAASDLNESISKTGVVFGDSAADILAWSEDSATSLLISQNAALGFASTFGNIFTSLGFTADEAANMSMGFVQLGADLASFNNVGTDQALEAIRSGLLGEYEPLKNLGIVLSEAEVEAKALEMQLADTSGELTQQDKILARQALIMERSTNAQGDAARTSAGFANQMRILQARLTNAAAAIGQILLPYVTRLVSFVSNLIARFEKMDKTAQRVVVVIALVAAAIGPLLVAIGTLMVVAGTLVGNWANIVKVMKAMRAATMSTLGPLLLIVAVIAALYFVWTRDLFGIRSKITAWFDAFKAGGGIDRLKDRFEAFKRVVLDLAGRGLARLVSVFRQVVDAVRGPATQAFGMLQQAMVKVVAAVAVVVGGIVSRLDPLKSAFYGVVQMITSFVGIITSLFEGDLRGALDNAVSLFEGWLQYLTGLGGFILSLVSGALSFIWTALAGVDWAGLGVTLLGYLETAIAELVTLASKMADKAEEMVSGFVAWVVAYNWVGLGRTMLSLIGSAILAIGALVEKLKPHAEEMITGFTDWIAGYDWKGLGTTILGFIELAASYLFLPLVLYKHGGQLIDGLKSGIDYGWNLVKLYLGGIAGKIVSAVGDFIETLYDKGKDVIEGMYDGVVAFWDDTLQPWLAAIGGAILTALKYIMFPLLLYYHGEDIIDGMLAGIEAAWFFVKNWFSVIKTKIVGFFGKAGEWLLEKGKDLLGGLRDGIYAVWYAAGGVWDWLFGLGSKVTGAVGEVTGTLVQKGKDLFTGLYNGLTSVWDNTIKPWIDEKIAYVANLPGISWLTKSPSRLYAQYGEDLMRGLAIGLNRAGDDPLNALGATVDAISGTSFVAPSMTAARNLTSASPIGSITINVSGAGDPGRVADEVYRRFSQELGLRGAV
jgi:hypothetical protein